MSKPFLEQLELWIEEKNFVELEKCEFKVAEMLRNYGRVASEMDEDTSSFLWKDSMALAIYKELKKLKTLVKKIDVIYKKRPKDEKQEVQN